VGGWTVGWINGRTPNKELREREITSELGTLPN